ncbi:MAG TPA: acyltransferase, partial [Burkholderiaceae bacterium]
MRSTASRPDAGHLAALDGWRGISILLVMAGHLLPLGPKALQFNDMAATMGMAVFFILSGFLITRFLLERPNVPDFLFRRFFRIVPLAWLAMVVILLMTDAPVTYYLPHFFFYANVPPLHLTDAGSHLWSLCVEVQFYVGIALLVALLGRRGLYALPVLCVAVTLHRVWYGAHVDIVTWRRVDEILAGCLLAMAYAGKFGTRPASLLSSLNAYVLLALLAMASHPWGGGLNYLRPYIAALMVGATLFNPPATLARVLQSRVLLYIATVSYALYVIHHVLVYT